MSERCAECGAAIDPGKGYARPGDDGAEYVCEGCVWDS